MNGNINVLIVAPTAVFVLGSLIVWLFKKWWDKRCHEQEIRDNKIVLYQMKQDATIHALVTILNGTSETFKRAYEAKLQELIRESRIILSDRDTE